MGSLDCATNPDVVGFKSKTNPSTGAFKDLYSSRTFASVFLASNSKISVRFGSSEALF